MGRPVQCGHALDVRRGFTSTCCVRSERTDDLSRFFIAETRAGRPRSRRIAPAAPSETARHHPRMRCASHTMCPPEGPA